MINKMLIVLLLAAFGSGAAFAQPDLAKKSPACNADVAKLCAAVEKGEGRIVKCLRENKERLSDACKADIKNMVAEARERRDSKPRGNR
jgi:hypothetical protein